MSLHSVHIPFYFLTKFSISIITGLLYTFEITWKLDNFCTSYWICHTLCRTSFFSLFRTAVLGKLGAHWRKHKRRVCPVRQDTLRQNWNGYALWLAFFTIRKASWYSQHSKTQGLPVIENYLRRCWGPSAQRSHLSDKSIRVKSYLLHQNSFQLHQIFSLR